jgi:hypothetical protein
MEYFIVPCAVVKMQHLCGFSMVGTPKQVIRTVESNLLSLKNLPGD